MHLSSFMNREELMLEEQRVSTANGCGTLCWNTGEFWVSVLTRSERLVHGDDF